MPPPTSWLSLGLYLALLTQARAILGHQTATALEIDTPAQLITGSDGVVRLESTSGSPAIVILDYNHSVEGIPTFEVLTAEGDTSVFEITYGESRGALSYYMVSCYRLLYGYVPFLQALILITTLVVGRASSARCRHGHLSCQPV